MYVCIYIYIYVYIYIYINIYFYVIYCFYATPSFMLAQSPGIRGFNLYYLSNYLLIIYIHIYIYIYIYIYKSLKRNLLFFY